MDYIKGRTLFKAWPTYSLYRKFMVAWSLRNYVRQLRRLMAPTSTTPPGPISVHGACTCDLTSLIGQQNLRGPFEFYSDFVSLFNTAWSSAVKHSKAPQNHPSRKEQFEDLGPQTLVLSHLDINPRNIIVDDDDRLWLRLNQK
ncbi:hypothetical protein CPB84DRAFT_191509 [Gymnopilus junonius]|uniref:Aminoglycoside phosphotransferase domain-containing protein n=1 Tax=Gymnopilus junonius TaxID=109634 RepID=A0A9P5NE60_GYMJU|nr:hypothetical protein CPB84DRAFT_191509 [Gymnopilus junonius]